jgi:hypothetical protein
VPRENIVTSMLEAVCSMLQLSFSELVSKRQSSRDQGFVVRHLGGVGFVLEPEVFVRALLRR